MRYFPNLKATTLSNYNFFWGGGGWGGGYWGYLHIFEKVGASLGRVFSAISGDWLSGLCHCRQSPLGTQLGVETQRLRVTFWPKIDSSSAVINFRRVRL